MPYLDLSSGQRLYYEIDNWSDAWKKPESVVMIHGFTENTTAYNAWVPHLARNYRVIRFDQLGFGRSSAALFCSSRNFRRSQSSPPAP